MCGDCAGGWLCNDTLMLLEIESILQCEIKQEFQKNLRLLFFCYKKLRTGFRYVFQGKELKRLEEKIKKWEEEIEKILIQQKEANNKYNERVRELRKKIETAKHQMTLENNQLIADVVRTIYGEVTQENIESFKRQMQSISNRERQS